MASNISIGLPAAGNALTQDVRDNFEHARVEISALQAGGGAQGVTGVRGATGATGVTGAIGATGASGAIGATGVSGTGGGGGPAVITGTSFPTGAQAVDGNLFFNTNTWLFYLHVAGAWRNTGI